MSSLEIIRGSWLWYVLCLAALLLILGQLGVLLAAFRCAYRRTLAVLNLLFGLALLALLMDCAMVQIASPADRLLLYRPLQWRLFALPWGLCALAELLALLLCALLPTWASAEPAEHSIGVSVSPDGAGTAEATVDGSAVSSAQEGESVRLSSTANAGYRFKEWAVSGAAAADPSLGVTSFTMGTEDVTATAVFERVYTIESVSCTSSGVASYFGDPYQLDAGTSVTPHFSSDSGEPPAGSVQISIFGIYTDPSYASFTELTTEPVEGTTYYSYFQLSDAAANTGVIDYSHLDASSVSISHRLYHERDRHNVDASFRRKDRFFPGEERPRRHDLSRLGRQHAGDQRQQG